MATYKTHISILEQSASDYPTRPVFRVPLVAPGSEKVEEWKVVTYTEFNQGVKRYAKHWSRVLSADGLPPRSVVGLW